MIEVSAALQQNNIIDLLENLNKDGIKYTYKEKKGVNLVFEVLVMRIKQQNLLKSPLKQLNGAKYFILALAVSDLV